MPGLSLIAYMLAIGIMSGLLAGLLGVGGGLLLVPILEYAARHYGIDGEELVRYTLANSFFAIIFAGLASSFKHYRNANFFPAPVLLTALPAIVSALLVAQLITHFNWYRKEYFNLIFVLMLVYVLIRMLRSKKNAHDLTLPKRKFHYRLMMTGLITGVASALSGLGGGMAMIPLFTEYVRMPIKKATSVSIGVIPLMMLPVSLVYGLSIPSSETGFLQWGYIVLPFTLPLIVGIFIGAPMGVNWAQRMQGKMIKTIFAGLIVIIIIRYIADTILHII